MNNENDKKGKEKNNYVEIYKTNNYGLAQQATKIHDIQKIQINLLNYYLYKIKCEIKTNNCILGIKLIYKNRNDNKKIDVINIEAKKKASLEQEYTFESSEYIVDLRLRLKDRLIGFEIATDKGEIKKFGYGDEEQLVKIPDFEKNR